MTTSPRTRAARRAVPPPDEPVFVDASGRRQRLVRRAGRLLVIPAVGYLALLLSSLLGGPSVDAPFLPQQHAERPPAPAVPAAPAGGTTSDGPSAPVSAQSATRTGQAVLPARPARTTEAPSATHSATDQPSAPVTTPTAGPGNSGNTPGHGRPSTAPSRKPSKTP